MQRRQFLKSGAAVGLAGLELARAVPFLSASNRQGSLIRLNANENPMGISERARQAILEELGEASRYPFSLVQPLAEAVAQRHELRPENVVLGNGSSEVIQMVVQAAAREGRKVVMADPTFESVELYSQSLPAEVRKIPLRSDHQHDLDAMRQAAESSPSLVYICNPNNPTATVTASRALDEWIAAASEEVVFLIDEAYFDYVEADSYWSAEKWVKEKSNVVVTRTFSKVFAMAGLRLGYALAHEEAAQRLSQWASDMNTNCLALAAGRATLQDPDFLERSLESNRRGKRILVECLEELKLAYLPSHTNFLMFQIVGELEQFGNRMKDAGILVGRLFPAFPHHCRVSIGLPEEMEEFARTLRRFRQKNWV